MTQATEAFARRVASRDPQLEAALREHLEDNFDELLPHVFFGEVTAWVDEQARADGSPGPAVAAVLADMEAGLRDPDLDVQELVAVSFLENLDDDSPVLALLGDHARQVRDEVLHRT